MDIQYSKVLAECTLWRWPVAFAPVGPAAQQPPSQSAYLGFCLLLLSSPLSPLHKQ